MKRLATLATSALAATVAMISLAALPAHADNASNGYPYCANGSASDPDGDGWGWENNASCVVRGSAADPGPATGGGSATPVRVMPLGDSITGSPGCWRADLYTRLRSGGYNIDFVGTLPAPGCGVTYDGDNEGHGGYLATNIANQNQLPGWLSSTRPDVVMMHLGTNDVWNNISTTNILAAYSRLVDQMRASKSNMKILVAKILPMAPSNCSACAQRVVNLNNAIPGWASGKSTSTSPITVVDQWSGFNTSSDTSDGVHPNANGNPKIASRWYPALTPYLTRTGSGGTAPNGYPYCANGSASDPDGDGWGWENNASCVVRGSAADH